jgi:hypothetical protein
MGHRTVQWASWVAAALVLAASWLSAAPAHAAAPAGEGQDAGRFEFLTNALGPVHVLKVADGHVYAGVGHRLQVYATAGRQRPRLVHEAPALDQPITDIAIDGTRVYVAASTAGIAIYDRSHPARPKRLGGLQGQGLAPLSLSASGPLLFAACGGAGIKVLDVSAPQAPRIVDTFTEGDTSYQRVLFRAPHLYAADLGGQFLVYDATVPSALKRLGALAMRKPVQQIAASGSLAYLAAGLSGLLIVDLADPMHPVQIGQSLSDPGEDAVGVALSGSMALVADRTYDQGHRFFRGRLRMVDVSNPRSPVQRDSVFGNLVGVDAEGARAYAGVFDPDRIGKIDVHDIAGSRIRPVMSAFLPAPNSSPVRVQGNDLLFPDVALARMNLDRPERPHLRWTRDVAEPPQGKYEYGGGLLALGDGLAFVFASSDTIRLVDISDIDRPKVRGRITLQGPPLASVPGTLYAKPWSSQQDVQIYDVRQLDAPARTASIPDTADVGKGLVYGRTLYLFPAFWSSRMQLKAYDIADAAAPVLLHSKPWYETFEMQVVGDRLYAGEDRVSGQDVLRVYSLAAAPALEPIGEWALPTYSTTTLRVCGTTAFFGNQQIGGSLLAVDVSDPAAPVPTAQYRVAGRAPYSAVCTDNNTVVVDVLEEGVHVLRYVPPSLARRR